MLLEWLLSDEGGLLLREGPLCIRTFNEIWVTEAPFCFFVGLTLEGALPLVDVEGDLFLGKVFEGPLFDEGLLCMKRSLLLVPERSLGSWLFEMSLLKRTVCVVKGLLLVDRLEFEGPLCGTEVSLLCLGGPTFEKPPRVVTLERLLFVD